MAGTVETAHDVASSISVAMHEFPCAAQPELHAASLLLPSFTETGSDGRDQLVKDLQWA